MYVKVIGLLYLMVSFLYSVVVASTSSCTSRVMILVLCSCSYLFVYIAAYVSHRMVSSLHFQENSELCLPTTSFRPYTFVKKRFNVSIFSTLLCKMKQLI